MAGVRYGEKRRKRATERPPAAAGVVGAGPVAAADPVDQDRAPSRRAAGPRSGPRGTSRRPSRAENIAAEADGRLGPADFLEHPRVGLVATVQHLDDVARLRRQARQLPDCVFKRRQRIPRDSRRGGGCGKRRVLF